MCLIIVAACQPTESSSVDLEKQNQIKVGILPDTQGNGSSVSLHPMEAVLDKLKESGVNIVIPVGDLTNHGSTYEFEQWTQLAKNYKEAGIEFLPLMGNHETSHAYSVEWLDFMKDYIPEDAVHMSGAEYSTYYVIRENVLFIMMKYYDLPISFKWVKEVVNQHNNNIDHIVMASHDGLVGAKYGQTRERIVQGVRGDNLLMDQWDDIRSFFSHHDVIWVQGHEHMYQRSVISAPIDVNPKSWAPSDRNYRIPQFTQIISGNASYKGYEFRYGERELIQNIIQQKMNTKQNGSETYDANASILTFNNSRVDYKSYVTSHTVENNEEGNKELEDPEWSLIDKFSRTTDRCERIIYPNSIPESTRPVLHHDSFYRTNECIARDGSGARILDGVNDTFNRIESTARSMSLRTGFSRAEDPADMARLAYQYLFQYHEPWTPNLNGDRRLVLSDDAETIVIPETTIDLKEHLTLSWTAATQGTVSDILIISGTQVQTGIYSNAFGMDKDIEKDTGHERSQPDGTAKQPHLLPASATKIWDIESAVADQYVLQFDKKSTDPEMVTLGHYRDGEWKQFTSSECTINKAYNSMIINQTSSLREDSCDGEPIVGYDNNEDSWWVVLNSDIEVALIEK
ncbi:MAG: metallophosphoesterase [Balneolales bacterium]